MYGNVNEFIVRIYHANLSKKKNESMKLRIFGNKLFLLSLSKINIGRILKILSDVVYVFHEKQVNLNNISESIRAL